MGLPKALVAKLMVHWSSRSVQNVCTVCMFNAILSPGLPHACMQTVNIIHFKIQYDYLCDLGISTFTKSLGSPSASFFRFWFLMSSTNESNWKEACIISKKASAASF